MSQDRKRTYGELEALVVELAAGNEHLRRKLGMKSGKPRKRRMWPDSLR